ncbi:hypothetical protein WJX74_010000 [Apatococcus lobatus]|uniref:Chlorophyllase n=1 Tax=Apatococcus lobatus TaxID=904363 RepID=A0AAW1QZJ3_9CHLO
MSILNCARSAQSHCLQPATVLRSPHNFSTSSGCSGQQCTGDITVTLPRGCAGPWPVLIFISGYGVPASYYAGVASGLAQSGFAVVQYDRSDPPPPNHVEVAFFDDLLGWISSWNATEGAAQLQDSINVAGRCSSASHDMALQIS